VKVAFGVLAKYAEVDPQSGLVNMTGGGIDVFGVVDFPVEFMQPFASESRVQPRPGGVGTSSSTHNAGGIVLTHDALQFRPGGPVDESGLYAARTPEGRTINVRHYPAGATLPWTREQDAYYVLVGLSQADSH
jgi:hypothetical protein